MTIHRLSELVRDDFDAVNQLIIDNIQSQHGLIDDLAQHIVQSGGKRLRPLLVLLASHACHYTGHHHITLAAMIEFFHTATLLHDDVVDESTLRRGRKTANTIWGNKASILVGDYLFIQYMQLMIKVGDLNIMKVLTDMTHEISCGEIQQLSHRYNENLSVADYFNVIRSKTSLLFASAAELGGLISQASDEKVKALHAYGLHLGNAFQLIDDALDYCSNPETLGKNIGDDLADGKATLPLIHALAHGSTAQKALIKDSLTKGSLDQLPDILTALADTKAIEFTRSTAEHEVNLAIDALSCIPNSVYKEALVELARYATSRDH